MKALFRRLVRPLLEFQVKRLIARHSLKVVGIGGSVGKTLTKAAVIAVLSQKYRVMAHEGNYNDTMSVPLVAFGLDMPGAIINPFAWIWRLIRMEQKIWGEFPYDILVLELGTDRPGEIPHFMSYLTPDIGVVTAISPEHMENLKTIEIVAEEEFALAHGSKQAVLNDAFDRLHPLAKSLKIEPIWYSEANLKPLASKLKNLDWPSYIRQALAAAVVVGEQLKLNQSQIIAGLESFKGVRGRMRRFDGFNGSQIIDDSYNSSPEAAIAALEYLDNLPTTGRRIVVMGNMNELGAGSPKYHAEVGAAAAGVDLLVTVGDLANDYLGPAAVSAGLDPTRFKPSDSPYAAGEFIKLILQPGDIVLVKGSQNGVFTEEATKILLSNPSEASRLVRQSPHWLATKRAQFPDAH